MIKFLLLTTFSIFPIFLFSQSSEGTDFWLGFMEHRNVNANTKVVMLTSLVNTSGTISIPQRGWSNNFEVNASEVTIIELPSYAETIGSEQYEETGIHITADDNISVYAHQYADLRSEAALILPEPALGNEYLVMSYFGFDGNNGNESYPSEFLVVGIEDETIITITPSDETLGGRPKDIPFTITLDRGETYQVQSLDGGIGDLTGSEIIGDKNFAVFGGAKWTQVPRGCLAMDNLYEQMYPISTWGRRFVTVPSEGVTYDIFRFLASENNTVVYQNGAVYASLDRGEYVEKQIFGVASYIESDKPILVAKYNSGNGCNGLDNGDGDPSMVFLNSVEQTKDSITLYSSPFENIDVNYIDLIVRTEDTSEVFVDGNKLSNSSFEVVTGNPDYAYAQLRVSSGTHNLYNIGCGMIVTAYGYGRFESYSYSGGAQFKKINLNPIPEGGCLNDTLVFSTGLPEGKAMAEWDFGDGNTSTELEPAHIYSALGTYEVELIVFDLCLNTIDTIYQDLLITLRDTIIAGDDWEVCTGEPIQLMATDVQNARYEWRGPNGFFSEEQNPQFLETRDTMSGIYSVVGIVSGCATFPADQDINIHSVPDPDLGNDTTICDNGPIYLESANFSRYRWQNGSMEREFVVTSPANYWVEVEDEIGCQGVDSVLITERCPPLLFVPSGFTPNGDGFNDYFQYSATDMLRFRMQVFNRWGKVVFTTDNPTEYWDGTLPSGKFAAEGVYIWAVNYDWPALDGSVFPITQSGTVTIVR